MADGHNVPRRTVALVVILIVVGVWALVVWMRGGGVLTTNARTGDVDFTSREVPELLPLTLGTPTTELDASDRNPFAYGPPPTPTPDLTPRPTRAPVPTRAIPPTPTPRMIEHNGKMLPPPPPFDRIYIGYLGPDRSRVAVFRNGEEIEIGAVGSVLNDKDGKPTYIVRLAEYDSVVIGFVGYPRGEITREALEEK